MARLRKLPRATIVGVLSAAACLLSAALAAQSADSKYDAGTTMFSPKGRLYQVEYAAEVWRNTYAIVRVEVIVVNSTA